MQNQIREFFSSINCDVKYDSPVSEIVTFKTGGKADVIATPHDTESLIKIMQYSRDNNINITLLGNGSNVLISDSGIRGIVLRMANSFTDIQCDGDIITVGAGVSLKKLCLFALSNSLSGLEFAYGIPGTVGGAICMNAGAYGGEIKDVLRSSTHITKALTTETKTNEELDLKYRDTFYSHNPDCIITQAVFSLKKGIPEEIKAQMDDFMAKRKDKQPLEYPSAGSTFKRPQGHFAGALIEQCNLKGFTHNGAMVSDKHAGFIINYNNATTKDILELISQVQDIVYKETGIMLETEVKYIE